MKENICTIPINDIFRETDGCPFCRMHDSLEEKYVDFITGSAMMNPDVRVVTNEKGFCNHHFNMMFDLGRKLPNALILQTHIQKIIDEHLPKKANSKPDKKQLLKTQSMIESCYVCDKIDSDMVHLLATVFDSWQKDEEFVRLYKAQEFVCLRHYVYVMNVAIAKSKMNAKNLTAFHEATAELCKNQAQLLEDDISHFCNMFDYRNAGGDFKNSKTAIQRSIKFLK